MAKRKRRRTPGYATPARPNSVPAELDDRVFDSEPMALPSTLESDYVMSGFGLTPVEQVIAVQAEWAAMERVYKARECAAFERARAAGVTWVQLAEALGCSAQAAQQKAKRLGVSQGVRTVRGD